MTLKKYPANERGVSGMGWLHSRFSFSFAHYYDPDRMSFGALRVLNDDVIDGGGGFPLHRHDNMEIITIVTQGTLRHEDSEGHGGILKAGDVQVMSAGSGIEHAELNNSSTEPLALFQLWIMTKKRDIPPRYDQKSFSFPKNSFVTLASGLDEEGALTIVQDARVVRGDFEKGFHGIYRFQERKGVFLMVIEGAFLIEGERVERRDVLEITNGDSFSFEIEMEGSMLIIETATD